MKHVSTRKKKNSWNVVVVLFGILHSIVALIIYELLWFQSCTDGLFLGACEMGRRMFALTLFAGWVVFSGSFTAMMLYGKHTYGKKIIPVSYLGALCITAGSLAIFVLSGFIVYTVSLLP